VKDETSRHVCHSNEGSCGCKPKSHRVGVRESTWGARMREPDDLVLHLVDREGVTVVYVCENLFVRLLVARGF
jgi:hypothetical protein